MRTTTLITLLALLFFSCNRTEVQEANSTPNVQASSGLMQALEGYASAHNQALDAIAAAPGFPETTLQQRHATVSALGVQLYGNDYIPTSLQYLDWNQYPLETLSEIAGRWQTAGLISATAAGEFATLESHILGNTLLSQQSSYQSGLEAFETRISAASNLNAAEKEYLLGASVIARYSGSYWNSAATSSSHAWHAALALDDIEESHLPGNYAAAFTGGGGGSTGLHLPFRLIYDLVMFVIWSEDCPEWPSEEQCYQAVWGYASIASGTL